MLLRPNICVCVWYTVRSESHCALIIGVGSLEVTSTSVYTGLNPFNFIRILFLQICLWDVSYVCCYCSFYFIKRASASRRTLNEIKTTITAYIRNISQADLQKEFANKIKWVQACIDARGRHFQTSNTFYKCTVTSWMHRIFL